MMNEVIEGWRVGAIYSAKNGQRFKIIEIYSNGFLTTTEDGGFHHFKFNGNHLFEDDNLKLLHRVSDIDTRRA